MAYVDLNPVRAGMAETPETSDYTSIQERLGFVPTAAHLADEGLLLAEPLKPEPLVPTSSTPAALPQALLMPFDATGRTTWAVPFALQDYVELVEWTGRLVHPAKRGAIAAAQPEILARMGIDGEVFIELSARFLKEFGSAVGAPEQLANLCARRQTRFLHGMRAARKVFRSQGAPKLV
jgi:hypothetical protein